MTPEDNPTSQGLKAGGDKNVAALKALKGAEFDRAYVDHEVAYHQQVLDAVDKTLIPGAKNEELKALLVKVRPAFVAHLEHAKHLQGRWPEVAGRRSAVGSRQIFTPITDCRPADRRPAGRRKMLIFRFLMRFQLARVSSLLVVAAAAVVVAACGDGDRPRLAQGAAAPELLSARRRRQGALAR